MIKMKKILFLFLVAGSLAACNNAGDAGQSAKDSLDSVTKLQKESVEEAAQDAKQNLDSANQAVKDSVDAALQQADTTKRAQ